MGARGTLQRGHGRKLEHLHTTVKAATKRWLVELAEKHRFSVGTLLDEFARQAIEKSYKSEHAVNRLPRKGAEN